MFDGKGVHAELHELWQRFGLSLSHSYFHPRKILIKLEKLCEKKTNRRAFVDFQF